MKSAIVFLILLSTGCFVARAADNDPAPPSNTPIPALEGNGQPGTGSDKDKVTAEETKKTRKAE